MKNENFNNTTNQIINNQNQITNLERDLASIEYDWTRNRFESIVHRFDFSLANTLNVYIFVWNNNNKTKEKQTLPFFFFFRCIFLHSIRSYLLIRAQFQLRPTHSLFHLSNSQQFFYLFFLKNLFVVILVVTKQCNVLPTRRFIHQFDSIIHIRIFSWFFCEKTNIYRHINFTEAFDVRALLLLRTSSVDR